MVVITVIIMIIISMTKPNRREAGIGHRVKSQALGNFGSTQWSFSALITNAARQAYVITSVISLSLC